MGILNQDAKATTIEYKFDLDTMKKLIASDMKVPEDELTIEYVIRDQSSSMDQYSNYVVTSIKVTHKPKNNAI